MNPPATTTTTFAQRDALLAEFSDEVCFELFVARRMPRDREDEFNHLMRHDLAAARALLQAEAAKLNPTQP